MWRGTGAPSIGCFWWSGSVRYWRVTKRLLSVANVRHAVNVTTGALAGQAASSTVERLLDAAAEAFADRGFHATSTRDIASRAGLSPAGVYVHFSSKEELLYQLSREGHEAARDMLVAASAGAGSPTEALRAIMGTFSRWHAEHFRVARIVQYEFGNLTPEHRDAVLGLRKEIDGVVRDVVTDG